MSESDFFSLVEDEDPKKAQEQQPIEQPIQAPQEAPQPQPHTHAQTQQPAQPSMEAIENGNGVPQPQPQPQQQAPQIVVQNAPQQPPAQQYQFSPEMMEELRSIAEQFGEPFNTVFSVAQRYAQDPSIQELAGFKQLQESLLKVNVLNYFKQKARAKQVQVIVIGKDKNYWKRSGKYTGSLYGVFGIEENGETRFYLGRMVFNGAEMIERLDKAQIGFSYAVTAEIPQRKNDNSQNQVNFVTLWANDLTSFDNGTLLSISYVSLLQKAGIPVKLQIADPPIGCGVSMTNEKGYALNWDLKAVLCVFSEDVRKIKAKTPEDAPHKIEMAVGSAFTQGKEPVQIWVPDFEEFTTVTKNQFAIVVGTISETEPNEFSDAEYSINAIAIVPLTSREEFAEVYASNEQPVE